MDPHISGGDAQLRLLLAGEEKRLKHGFSFPGLGGWKVFSLFAHVSTTFLSDFETHPNLHSCVRVGQTDSNGALQFRVGLELAEFPRTLREGHK